MCVGGTLRWHDAVDGDAACFINPELGSLDEVGEVRLEERQPLPSRRRAEFGNWLGSSAVKRPDQGPDQGRDQLDPVFVVRLAAQAGSDREPGIGGVGLDVEAGLVDLGEYGAAVDLRSGVVG